MRSYGRGAGSDSGGVRRKKIDYGRASEVGKVRAADILSELSASESLSEPSPSPAYSGGSTMDKSVIGVIVGCIFLLVAVVAVSICLMCLYNGVFGQLDPLKALAGFAGSVFVAYLAGWAGWRFLYRT
ncbi:MAG: hypothetical protein JNG88_11870 [Phycisphaerales bacterium]|nr:hypothetical protein [Phycisphaerales bacterium]